MIFFVLGLCPMLTFGQSSPAFDEGPPTPPESATLLFRFVAGKDAFYVPWQGNGATLDMLLTAVREHMAQLRDGRIYIRVTGYAPTGSATCNPVRTGYLRNCRVKSELITRAGATEVMFITDKYIAERYGGLRDVVVVTFPVNATGCALSPTEVASSAETSSEGAEPDFEAERACPTAESATVCPAFEDLTADSPSESGAFPEIASIAGAACTSGREHSSGGVPATEEAFEERPRTKKGRFALRTNLLRWATLTPDAGIEWHLSPAVSVAVNGSYTSWTWQGKERRYALWELLPEVRWYPGRSRRCYVGAMFHVGAFNYKLSAMGKMGDLTGGGITGGYRLPVGRRLAFDFSAGAGCTHVEYDKYDVEENMRIRRGSASKNYWGVNHLTVGLVWTFGGCTNK